MIVRVIVEGVVMEKKNVPFKRGGQDVVAYRIYQPGEIELIEVQYPGDGIALGEKVRAEGRLAVRALGKKYVTAIIADALEVVL